MNSNIRNTEPYFKGKGSEWICRVLDQQQEYIACLEAIMYPLTSQLSEKSRARGFPYEEELPPIDFGHRPGARRSDPEDG